MSGWTAAVDGAGLALAGSAVLAVRGLPAWEARVFRAVNRTPGWVTTVCWGPMQMGAGAAPFVIAAAVALHPASRASAPAVALGGGGASVSSVARPSGRSA